VKRTAAALIVLVILLAAETAAASWPPPAAGSGRATARSIGVPTGVTATPLSSGSIQVGWSPPTGVTPSGYVVTRISPSAATVCTVGSGTTTCTDTGLAAGTTYTYTVQARLATHWSSGASAPASATTPNVGTFVVTVPSGNRTAGSAFNATLRATTNGVTTNTSYSGVKTITFSGPAVSPGGTTPVYPATVNFSAGVGTARIRLYAAETATLHATDGTISGSTSVTVVARAGSKLGWTSSSADCSAGFVVVGNGGSYTSKVSVYDTYGNLATRGTNRTISISRNPSSGTVSPTSLTVPANLSETSGSTTYTLPNGNPPNVNVTASASGLTSVVCQVRKN
jgi:hypothetical protein